MVATGQRSSANDIPCQNSDLEMFVWLHLIDG